MALEFAPMNKACIIGGYYVLNGSFKLSQRAWNFQKFSEISRDAKIEHDF